MAGRKAAPKPAAPKTTNRQRRQSRVETTSDTPVDRSMIEADLVKLIDSLTEWTREMQAARPAAPEAPAPRRRSPSRAKKVAVKASATPLYERGNPLTQSMTFTDRDGAVWLAYVEGAEPAPTGRLRKPTVLPGRHEVVDRRVSDAVASRTNDRSGSLLGRRGDLCVQRPLRRL